MQDDDPYNGKVLLAAVICLSTVVIFVLLLHAYGRWLLRGGRTTGVSEVHLPGRWSSAAEAEEVGFSRIVNGLDAKVVAALPEFVYRATEKQGRTADCVVCLSAMEDGERGRILPRCGHGFHAGCIDAWLTAQSTCPICRAAVAAQETEEVVVFVDSDVFPAGGVGVTLEVSGEVSVEIMPVSGGGQESSSSTAAAAAEVTAQSSSCTSSLAGCSVKRMLSKSRSDKRVFPSALGDRAHVEA
ncbi:E3 ubiquitin-protein ligase ATL6 [Platanthera zijinensis]|uniref:RING-type E3 ubiquitin transferase n=1 Tax=Platanthera zijinensis TaxID=2320716 RepID=A0AAP0BPB7_9ASPA